MVYLYGKTDHEAALHDQECNFSKIKLQNASKEDHLQCYQVNDPPSWGLVQSNQNCGHRFGREQPCC